MCLLVLPTIQECSLSQDFQRHEYPLLAHPFVDFGSTTRGILWKYNWPVLKVINMVYIRAAYSCLSHTRFPLPVSLASRLWHPTSTARRPVDCYRHFSSRTSFDPFLTMNPQTFEAPLTQSATFLILSAADESHAVGNIRSAISSIPDITKNISTRHPSAHLSCIVGIGSKIWDELTQKTPNDGVATIQRGPGRQAHRSIDTGRPAVPHSIRKERYVLRI